MYFYIRSILTLNTGPVNDNRIRQPPPSNIDNMDQDIGNVCEYFLVILRLIADI